MNTSAMIIYIMKTVMTARTIKLNAEVITQVNGLKRSELLARIPAATMLLNTAIKILAKVRNIRHLFKMGI